MRPLILFTLALPLTTIAADWPQWRGPDRNGSVKSEWPGGLDKLERVWRVELQPSYSSPVVFGDRVFTTETVSKKIERVRALDRDSGKVLWEKTWEGAMSVPFFAKRNGDWIRATPATDGKMLFAAGIRDVVLALDVKDGTEKWRVDFAAKFKAPLPTFGMVCSPLIDGESLYVQAGGGFCRLDKNSGELIWRTLDDGGGMMGSAFSSPIIATLAGKRQILVQTREKLAGVNPDDGKVLWEQPVEAFRGMNILTPVNVGDMLYTSTYGGKTQGWKASLADGKWTISKAWEHKSQGYMTTPVVVKDTAYTSLRSGRMMSINVLTGAEGWTSSESFGDYVSLATNGPRILGLDTRGNLNLFEAAAEKFTRLGSKKIAETETWAHVAVCDDQIFVRELEGLAMWRWSK